MIERLKRRLAKPYHKEKEILAAIGTNAFLNAFFAEIRGSLYEV